MRSVLLRSSLESLPRRLYVKTIPQLLMSRHLALLHMGDPPHPLVVPLTDEIVPIRCPLGVRPSCAIGLQARLKTRTSLPLRVKTLLRAPYPVKVPLSPALTLLLPGVLRTSGRRTRLLILPYGIPQFVLRE